MRAEFFNKFNRNKHFTDDYQIITETLLDVYNKNAKDLSNADFSVIMSCDPALSDYENMDSETLKNAPESYSKWLIRMFKRGEMHSHPVSEIRDALKTFEYAKRRRTLLPNNDINAYNSIDAVKQALANLNQLSTRQQNKDAKKDQQALTKKKEPGIYMDGNVELLFNGDSWEVWKPLTFKGSKALRRGAVWCTGGDTSSHFDAYSSDGELFVIINKLNEKEKYQLFVPEYIGSVSSREKEFRDADNESLNFRKFCHDNPELLNYFKDVVIVSYSYKDLEDPDKAENEWSDEKEEEIRWEYDLEYDDYNGLVSMNILYGDLLRDNYITVVDDYKEVATTGFLDYPNCSSVIINNLKSYMVHQEDFLTIPDWDSTDLYDLYRFFIHESKLDESKVDFEYFLRVIFDNEYREDNQYYEKIDSWLSSLNKDYQDLFVDCVTASPVVFAIGEYVYTQLKNLGWDSTKGRNNSYYFERFESGFLYTFDNIYTIEEFYNQVTRGGELSKDEICREYNIYIKERDGDIDINSEHYDIYCGNYEHKDNAEEFVRRLLDGDFTKMNEFLTSEE